MLLRKACEFLLSGSTGAQNFKGMHSGGENGLFVEGVASVTFSALSFQTQRSGVRHRETTS